MTGKCKDCIEKNKTLPGYCCVLCALGLSISSDNVVKDPFTGTVHIDLSVGSLRDATTDSLEILDKSTQEGESRLHFPTFNPDEGEE